MSYLLARGRAWWIAMCDPRWSVMFYDGPEGRAVGLTRRTSGRYTYRPIYGSRAVSKAALEMSAEMDRFWMRARRSYS